jgi:hypothetical protein
MAAMEVVMNLNHVAGDAPRLAEERKICIGR